MTIVIIVIIIVAALAAVVGIIYGLSRPEKVTVGLATSTNLGSAGSPVQFTVIPSLSGATVKSVSWNFGDGNTTQTSGAQTSHIYSNGGSYLVEANASVSYTSGFLGYTSVASDDQALVSVEIQSNLSATTANDGSVPSIGFPTSTNPTAPVFSTGNTVAPVGGFLEAPSNTNYTIESYTWNFGNGFTKTVAATNVSTPSQNVTSSYSGAGLYPITLTITCNDSSGATDNISTVNTVAVQSSSRSFVLLSAAPGSVVNPGVITLAEVTPGGPASYDPLIDYDSFGGEVLTGVFQTLVQYNGSSTDTFLPVVAETLPTQQNGGISANFMTYNFSIRPNNYFSNGDPVNAYAVWYSFMRAYAYASGPVASWVLDQFLVPGVQNGTATFYGNNTYANAIQTVTYSNATQTVAFNFNRPMPSVQVFQIISSVEGEGIMDPSVIKSVGAGWTQANWNNYSQTSEPGDYNQQLAFNPQYIIGSGPFMIKSLTPGQSIELVPNPKYTPTPGIPAATDDIVIDWLSNANTALLMLEDGQADSANGIPPSDYPIMQKLQSQGLINVYNFPTAASSAYILSIDLNTTMQANQWGSGYNQPSNYFADLPTRYAWIDSYDYQGFLNNILGNDVYNTTFGIPYTGWMVTTETGNVPPSEVGGLPQQNLQWAKANFSESAWKDDKITIPIGITVFGPQGQVQIASAEEWAQTLSQISGGNITAKIVQEPLTLGPLAFQVVPLSWFYSGPNYPSSQDDVDSFYPSSGVFAPFEGYSVQNFATLPPNNSSANMVNVNGTLYSQATVYGWIDGNVSAGDVAPTAAAKQQDYAQSEYLMIKMALYVYQDQFNGFWYWRTWLHGIQNEEGMMLPGTGVTYVYWLSKS